MLFILIAEFCFILFSAYLNVALEREPHLNYPSPFPLPPPPESAIEMLNSFLNRISIVMSK